MICYKKIVIVCFLLFCAPALVFANPVRELFEKGVDAYEHNQFTKAIELFESAIKLYPDLAPAYNYLGLCHKSLNTKPKTVIGFFEKAIEIDPNYLLAYDNLAKIYYGLNDYQKAEEYNLKALEINPNLLSSNLSLGWINLLGKSDATEAIYYFEKVIEINPMPYAYFGLGLANFLDNDNVEVLNSITILRNAGQEPLAQHLERMLREKRYIAPEGPRPASSRILSDPALAKKAGASFKDKNPSAEGAGMKVRLRKK